MRVFPYVKRKGSNFSQQIARRGLRLSSQQAKGDAWMNTRVQKNQSLRGDTKKVFALVFLSLLTGSTLLGQVPQSTQQLTFRGISTLSGPALMSPTEVGLEVQPYHRGHNAADVRPAMTSRLPLVPLSPPTASGQVVVSPDPGFSGFPGLTHYDQRFANSGNQFSLEPPDQGLCVGNGFVMEAVNLALAVYNPSGTRLSGPMALSPFFGLPPVIDRSKTPPVRGPFLSDPRCYFDPDTQRWFVTVLEISTNPATGSFTNHSTLQIAVSQSSNPRGNYFLFALDSTDDGSNGTPNHANCPCLGDQPLIGADANGFYVSTNELPISGPGFNGAQVYAMSKSALAAGTLPPVVHFDTGAIPTPDAGGVWYSIQPATSPSHDSQSDAEFFLSALDFHGALDNRLAVWALTNTSSLKTSTPMVTLKHVVIGSEVYGTPRTNAQQKSGPTPLRDSLGDADPLEQLASNDDRMNQVVFAKGKLWSGVNTVATVGGEPLVASAFFVVKPSLGSSALSASMDDQGYVAVAHENVLFPSIGVTANGAAAVVFTLAGPDYFPSAAYSPINASAGDVRLAGPGIGPEDGFSGYAALQPNGMSNGGVARWGDYSAAVADGDGNIWIATEYIGQTCTDAQSSADLTCNKTRSQNANWGTFIGKLPTCRAADGDGDLPGRNGGSAHFHVHEDDCNRQQDSEDFSDPGSGTDFHSTQVNSVSYDNVAHTVTIAGLGTNNGLPVAFTIVAVDSSLVPPGMFSITLSNGYANSGNLLDGNIALH